MDSAAAYCDKEETQLSHVLLSAAFDVQSRSSRRNKRKAPLSLCTPRLKANSDLEGPERFNWDNLETIFPILTNK